VHLHHCCLFAQVMQHMFRQRLKFLSRVSWCFMYCCHWAADAGPWPMEPSFTAGGVRHRAGQGSQGPPLLCHAVRGATGVHQQEQQLRDSSVC
jgi:hypothetical protein